MPKYVSELIRIEISIFHVLHCLTYLLPRTSLCIIYFNHYVKIKFHPFAVCVQMYSLFYHLTEQYKQCPYSSTLDILL